MAFRTGWFRAICLLILASFLGSSLPATAQEPTLLSPGPAQTVTLDTQRIARYEVEARGGHMIHVIVEQKNVDVALILNAPDGTELVRVDGLLGGVGDEILLWVAQEAGRYRLSVESFDRPGPTRRYSIRLAEPFRAGAADLKRSAAARLYYEGRALQDAGRKEAALEKLGEALVLWQELGEDRWRAYTHHALASLRLDLEETIVHHQTALELGRGDAPLLAMTHLNLAERYLEQDEIEAARQHFAKSLARWEETEDRLREGHAANNLGYAHRLLREADEALQNYDRALRLFRRVRYSEGIATALLNRGKIFISQGKAGRSLEDLREALAIYERIEDTSGIAITLTATGQALRDRDQLEEALDFFQRALELRGEDRRGRAVTLNGLGEVHFKAGEIEKARKAFQEALAILREVGDRRSESDVLRNLSRLQETTYPENAAVGYRKSLEYARAIGDQDSEAASLLGLARLEKKNGDKKKSLRYIEAALEKIDAIRLRLTRSDFRSSYFATKQNYYDFYIELLMELQNEGMAAGYEELALAASERARGRSLLDSLIEAGADLRNGADSKLLEREQALERNIATYQFQLTELLTAQAEEKRTEALKKALRQSISELESVRTQIRKDHPLYAELTRPRPLAAKEIQDRVLDSETLLLEYQLNDSGSFLWAVSQNSLESFRLAPRAEIERLAKQAYELLNVSHKRRYRALAARALEDLSALLLLPARTQIEEKSRLLIVAEGTLQYIPFAALPVPGRSDASDPLPLVARHEIVSVPSASSLYALRQAYGGRPKPPRGVAVLADPVFRSNDPRVPDAPRRSQPTNAPAGRHRRPDSSIEPPARLIHTLKEAEAILEHAEDRGTLLATGFDANKDAVLSRELKEYRYIHIATHGHLDPEYPELSSLVLSLVDPEGEPRNGFLQMHEIYHLDVAADLVVLSACQTARGREVRGEGLVGWTQGFMYSGAQRVLVSLWNVDDEATSELMRLFYSFLFQGEAPSPAWALRQAQDAVRSRPEWQAPYYWAGFVLQGEYL